MWWWGQADDSREQATQRRKQEPKGHLGERWEAVKSRVSWLLSLGNVRERPNLDAWDNGEWLQHSQKSVGDWKGESRKKESCSGPVFRSNSGINLLAGCGAQRNWTAPDSFITAGCSSPWTGSEYSYCICLWCRGQTQGLVRAKQVFYLWTTFPALSLLVTITWLVMSSPQKAWTSVYPGEIYRNNPGTNSAFWI